MKTIQKSEKAAIEISLSACGRNLYIFFGGMAAGIVVPPFEFYNSSKIIDENKIFVRDFAQCWYHGGLPQISHDIGDTVVYFQHQIEQIKPDKVFFIGNSMGGYAAILFASLLGRGEAIAFSPQTFLSPYLRLKYRDFRWQLQILNTYRVSLAKRKVWDLERLLSQSTKTRKISVFVSTDERLDMVHADHIKHISGVNVHTFSGGGHGVVKLLRDQGKLPAIMSGTYC